MTARDDLAADIRNWIDDVENEWAYLPWTDNLARHLLATGWSRPRVVTTAAELDELPTWTVVRSSAGTTATRLPGRTRGAVFGDDRSFPWSKLQLPATVLWSPEEAQR